MYDLIILLKVGLEKIFIDLMFIFINGKGELENNNVLL